MHGCVLLSWPLFATGEEGSEGQQAGGIPPWQGELAGCCVLGLPGHAGSYPVHKSPWPRVKHKVLPGAYLQGIHMKDCPQIATQWKWEWPHRTGIGELLSNCSCSHLILILAV